MNKLVEKFRKEMRWVNWRYEIADGKQTKVPYTITGKKASTTNPETWNTYESVMAVSDKVGIIFKPDQLLLGIDIDHCLENGLIVHEQQEIIMQFLFEADTYVETSPSGTGLHIFLSVNEPLSLTAHKREPYEVYSSGRYFTVTSKPYGEEKEIRTVTVEEAIRLLKIIGYPWKKEAVNISTNQDRSRLIVTIEDSDVLNRMFSSKNGGKIKTLYNGDISAYRNDDSSADMALCSHLAFWTGKNPVQMERLWLVSPLGARQKVQERKDYRERTISNAILGCNEIYTKIYMDSPNNTTSHESTNPITHGQKSEAIIACFADIKPEPINWLWPQRIALGKITLIAGDPGLGKSLLTTTLAAIVSKGYKWPCDDIPAQIGSVVMLSAEDDAADTIRPRLDAVEADCTRIHIIKAIRDTDARGRQTQHIFSFKRDLAVLEQILPSIPDCKLLIVDPVSSYLDNTDSNNNSDIRGLFAPLAELAGRFKIAVVLIQHLNKGNGAKALYRPMGSLAFIASARTAYIVTLDQNNPSRVLFISVKNNIAKAKSGLAYSVIQAENEAAVIVWEKELVTMTADEALAQVGLNAQNNDTDEAEGFLKLLLFNGPMKATECEKEAADAGISKKTLRRAREQLCIKPKKRDFKEGWWWSLPEDAQDVLIPKQGILETNGHLQHSYQ